MWNRLHIILKACNAFILLIILLTSTAVKAQTQSVPNKLFSLEKNSTEEVNKRNRVSKTLKLSDGRHAVRIFKESVHYLDEFNKWQDIDNTIRASSEPRYAFENSTNGVKSYFPLVLSDKIGVKLSFDAGSYTMGGAFSFAMGNDIKNGNETDNIKIDFSKTSVRKIAANKVAYDADHELGYLEYEVGSDELKQQFILKQLPPDARNSSMKYLFMSETIELPSGWSLEADRKTIVNSTVTSGQLTVKDSYGNAVSIIPIPEVYEKNNTNVILHPDGFMKESFFVQKLGKGNKYMLRVSVPLNWLTAPEREFPIVIDPSSNIPGNFGGWMNTSPAFLDGNPTSFVFTGLNTNGFEYRGYNKFDISAINDHVVVDSVILELVCNGHGDGTATVNIEVNDVDTANYGPYGTYIPAVYTDFGDGTYTTLQVTGTGTYSNINLGPQAAADLQNQLSSSEFQIALDNENGTGSWKRFTSNQNNITVYYTDPPEISSVSLAADNSYIDVSFTNGVYNTNGGAGAIETDDLDLSISGGSATNPTVTSVTTTGGVALGGGESVIRVNFSVTGTPDGNEILTVNPVSNSVFNVAGYAAAESQSNNTASLNDQTAPAINSIVRQSPATSPTGADQLVWDVTFSETVVNVGTDDFSVSGTTAAVTGVTNPSGNTYRVTVSGGDLEGLSATVTLGISGAQDIGDAAGNALTNTTPAGTNDNTFDVDNTGPTLSIGTPSSTLTSNGPVSYGITYVGASTINLTVGDIVLNTSGSANGSVSVNNGTTTNPTVTISNINGVGTIGISINAGTSSDASGNTDLGAGPSQVFSINTAPSFTAIQNQTMNEDDTLKISIDAFDDDGDWLIYESLSSNSSVKSYFVENELYVVPATNWSGSSNVVVYVSDPYQITTWTFRVEVLPVNDAPQISFQLSPFTFNEDEEIIFSMSEINPFITDPDNSDSTLIVTLESKSGNLTITELNDTTLIISSKEDWYGLDSITVNVSDGELTTSASLAVNVLPVNDIPMFENLPEKLTIETQEGITIAVFELVEDAETADTSLTIKIFAENDSLQFTYN